MVDKVNTQEFKSLIQDPNNLLVVDCYADWCMPCKMSSPAFAKMSEKYTNKAKFIKVNVDEEPSIAHAFNVRGVPSFFILKGNKIKEMIVGADLRKLETSLQKNLAKQNDQSFFLN